MAFNVINLEEMHALLKTKVKPDISKESSFNVNLSSDERPWYLCTPYSKFPGGVEEAYQMACEMTLHLQKTGLFIYCPIVHSHGPSLYNDPKDNTYDFWLTIDFKYVNLCKGLIVCKMAGWNESYGVNEEIKLATKLRRPVLYTNFMEIPKELQ